MPTSNNIAGSLDNQQTQLVLQQQQAIIDAAQVGAVRDNQFVFFAGFDGTLNDRADVGLSGNPLNTNVAQIFQQAQTAMSSNQNLVAEYYRGVGTQDTEWASAALPTGQAIATAQKAYNDFVKAADDWLNTDATKVIGVNDKNWRMAA